MSNKSRYVIVIAIVVISLSLGVFIGILIKDNQNKNDNILNNKVIDTPNHNLNQEDNNVSKNDEVNNMRLKLTLNGNTLYATFTDNSTSKALIERLKQGNVVVNMSDYAGMEKVGELGFSLPENNEILSTNTGDIILYEGNKFVIYYGQNNYNLTSIAKIENITKEELLAIMGNSDFAVILSLEEKEEL